MAKKFSRSTADERNIGNNAAEADTIVSVLFAN